MPWRAEMKKYNVRIKLLDSNAVVPSRAHNTDTGYDLTFTGIDKVVGDVVFFKTSISLQPPSGYYFEIVPRSSISKLPLEMANSVGIIDESYRGEILIPVRVTHQQMGTDPRSAPFPSGIVQIFGFKPDTLLGVANLVLQKKPCLFQAILKKRFDCKFEVISDLDSSERENGGFGSTDINSDDIPILT
jgi:dUTP pyrophosphatase